MEKAEVWTREKVRDVLQELANMDEFDCVPIPESIAKEYNIPFTPAKSLSFKEFISEHRRVRNSGYADEIEIRKGDGILRTFNLEEKPIELIVCKTDEVDKYLIKDETSDETSSEPPQNQDTAKEDDMTKNQQSSD
jgi:hypothetical protein